MKSPRVTTRTVRCKFNRPNAPRAARLIRGIAAPRSRDEVKVVLRIVSAQDGGISLRVLVLTILWRRLYVASKGGVRVYVPLENVGGQPVLRIYEPNR